MPRALALAYGQLNISLDQSLKRMGLEYVDIFYHHRPDPETPLEETMAALVHVVRQGKALYVGISQYDPVQTESAARILRALGMPCLIHQPNYNLFDRWIEGGLTNVLREEGIGCIVFSPLAQGLLSDKYLRGIPPDSRAAKPGTYLDRSTITSEILARIRRLNDLAQERGQSLVQMALAWVLRDPAVTSALIGASRPGQIDEAVKALNDRAFSAGELKRLDQIIKSD